MSGVCSIVYARLGFVIGIDCQGPPSLSKQLESQTLSFKLEHRTECCLLHDGRTIKSSAAVFQFEYEVVPPCDPADVQFVLRVVLTTRSLKINHTPDTVDVSIVFIAGIPPGLDPIDLATNA